ncbi:pyruvate dehydrogenase (acetyl-transferring), homodimeric type [Nitrosococcus watsonii]|uniref:Pyruvate dehydrogenase E1 component n=1 Tax=Nitrosococcus watsoni (strain C-113) TaxID=105559 RepID=D8K599_NITWC|nr:pyruvate dehydrogenase (acetyl-transferring), homodimeric type [Nitrosococcus watsonii]ADJ28076.1 2-oxo-acid dehydrogenase E1 subunit, homodimeric type [Nitrosococcus watsonii C-113]
MAENKAQTIEDIEAQETREWLESLDYVLQQGGPQRTVRLLDRLRLHAQKAGVSLPYPANTPYINTIPVEQEVSFPGSQEIERRIRSLVRWNAMAMVVRANREEEGIGGHISTFSSAATLYEVGFNHFFRARSEEQEADIVYFQGHASPGFYARAFLEGRLSEQQLENFRRELKPEGGLPSYPHPWLMPDFWEFPTVSMGLGPIMAIYQARFNSYLEDRGLKKPSGQKVWAFIGDGETDEPETLGAISLAVRERLDNLIFVVNCNLQRLDGPVRGNGKIIQELEAIFRGAGWNVIKVIWGRDWDPLLAKDYEGVLVRRMEQAVDGDYQKYAVESGSYIRKHFFGTDPRLQEMVKHLSDEQLRRLRTGGHDPEKVYAAYKAAVDHQGSPTVILARTIKGYGLGEAGEGKNITHQQKKLNEQELRDFRTRFGIPISDNQVAQAPFYKPPEDSPEFKYLHERRRALGGYLPARQVHGESLQAPSEEFFTEFYAGTGERTMATTMAYVRVLTKLLRDPEIGKLIVPIIPDEARTFGMESLFRQVGIYSHVGQLYEPVDSSTLLYYKEATDGQILEEGITEAGSMSSFIAAGTAYATHGITTIPFFTFYSMFGFQRIGDLIWAAGDMRCRGFLVGATAGRTTLAGEGLQHQDGQSQVLAYSVPNLKVYDPAYAYEIAVIIQDGMRRMYQQQEDIFYYLTVTNELYPMPEMPEGTREGILKGMYRLKTAANPEAGLRAQLFGSGAILNEVLKAQKLLENYQVAADVWSITSYKELYLEGHTVERWNMLHPLETPRVPYVRQCLQEAPGVFVAASDYLKVLPDSIYRWFPRPVVSLGTDGFGRSDGRRALRDFFEVDARFITLATLGALAREEKVAPALVQHAIQDLDIDPEKANPMIT